LPSGICTVVARKIFNIFTTFFLFSGTLKQISRNNYTPSLEQFCKESVWFSNRSVSFCSIEHTTKIAGENLDLVP